jgi:hypothetical protein
MVLFYAEPQIAACGGNYGGYQANSFGVKFVCRMSKNVGPAAMRA